MTVQAGCVGSGRKLEDRLSCNSGRNHKEQSRPRVTVSITIQFHIEPSLYTKQMIKHRAEVKARVMRFARNSLVAA